MPMIIVFPLLFFNLVSTLNSSEKKTLLHSASELDYPPFCIVNKNEKADGFAVDLLEYVTHVMGMQITFKVAPWPEIKNELKNRKLDVLPFVGYSKERAKYFDFSIPYIVLYGGIFTRKNNTTIKTTKDLYGTEVIVMKGDTAHEYVLKNKLTDKIITTKSYANAFKLLSEGKHDAVVVKTIVGHQLIDQLSLHNIQHVGHTAMEDALIHHLGKDLINFEQKFSFAVPKGNRATLDKLNKGLIIAFKNGTYNNLVKKWFHFLPKEQIDFYTIIKYALLSIIFISLVIFVIIFIILKRQVKIKTKEINNLAKFPSENPFPIIRVGFNKNIIYANEGALKVFNKKRSNFTTIKNLPHLENCINEAISSSKINTNFKTKVNNRYFSWSIIPIIKEKYINIYGSDITIQNKIEKDLAIKSHNLGERVKELNCLYGISKLIEKPTLELKQIYQGIVELIPPAWQYPEVTSARLLIFNEEFKTAEFTGSHWKLESSITVGPKKAGYLEVYYSVEKPQDAIGPFLKEEKVLLDLITERLGRVIEQMSTQDELTKANKKLEKLVFTDSLTGLINRKPFMDLLNIYMKKAKRNNTKIALFFLDINNFKNINDEYGHETGDYILRTVADKIKENTRESDFCGRWGGDEFLICMDTISTDTEIIKSAQRISEIFTEKFKVNNLIIDIEISIGIAVYPIDAKNVTELVRYSDLAMYKAKQTKSCFYFYDQHLENKRIFDMALTHAMKNNEFKTVYQPIVDRNRKLYSIETLLRWENSKFGTVMPLDFIPYIEKNKQIIEVGNWIFRQACGKLNKLKNNNPEDIFISVNVSQYQLESNCFVDNINDIIKETKVNPKNIIFEITEKTQIHNIEKIKKTLNDIKKVGIGLIALDDFGSGYSSFSNLYNLPINIVKLDKFFVDRLYVKKYYEVTSGLIMLLKKYNLKIIAEGIETERQFKLLKNMGCDYFQGFYFGYPE